MAHTFLVMAVGSRGGSVDRRDAIMATAVQESAGLGASFREEPCAASIRAHGLAIISSIRRPFTSCPIPSKYVPKHNYDNRSCPRKHLTQDGREPSILRFRESRPDDQRSTHRLIAPKPQKQDTYWDYSYCGVRGGQISNNIRPMKVHPKRQPDAENHRSAENARNRRLERGNFHNRGD